MTMPRAGYKSNTSIARFLSQDCARSMNEIFHPSAQAAYDRMMSGEARSRVVLKTRCGGSGDALMRWLAAVSTVKFRERCERGRPCSTMASTGY